MYLSKDLGQQRRFKPGLERKKDSKRTPQTQTQKTQRTERKQLEATENVNVKHKARARRPRIRAQSLRERSDQVALQGYPFLHFYPFQTISS